MTALLIGGHAVAGCALGGCAREGLLVAGAGLRLEDASAAGVAYVDRLGALFFAPLGGGAPVDGAKIAGHVDDAQMPARDAGLVVSLAGLDAADAVAADVRLRAVDGTVAPLGSAATPVRIDNITATADGAHLYHEERLDKAAGTEDLFLDGERVVPGAHREKARFTSGGALILGANIPDGAGGVRKVVRVYDDGDVRELVGDGAANETAVTGDGAHVIVGVNERGEIADLAVLPVAGGPAVALATQVRDTRFLVTSDDRSVLFIDDAGGVGRVDLDGSGRATVLDAAAARAAGLSAAGAEDLVAVTARHVVYASAIDLAGRMTLGAAALDGSGAVDLGGAALAEGVTPDGRFWFRDGVALLDGGHTAGTLRVFDGDAVRAAGSDVRKAQITPAGAVAFIDTTDHLRILRPGEATAELVQINVDRFDVAGDDVAWSVRAGANAGIWLLRP